MTFIFFLLGVILDLGVALDLGLGFLLMCVIFFMTIFLMTRMSQCL